MTDTIGWGDTERLPRRLPRVGHSRRRRVVALAVVAVLVAAVAAWPSFRSWRADTAASRLEQLWARAVGTSAARLQTLARVQVQLGAFDVPLYTTAIHEIDAQAIPLLQRLRAAVDGLRTWSTDVTRARTTVDRAIAGELAALARELKSVQAGGLITLLPDPRTPTESGSEDAAQLAVEQLVEHRHLATFVPASVQLDAAAAILAQVRRPSDTPLHLHLVSVDSQNLVVTDLDTGKVLSREFFEPGPDGDGWNAVRLLDRSLVIQSSRLSLLPIDGGGQRPIAGLQVMSLTGSPMWVLDPSGGLVAVDGSGRRLGGPFTVAGWAMTGAGDGTAVIGELDQATPDGRVQVRFGLMRPRSGTSTELPVRGCPMSPAIDGGVVAVPEGPRCGTASTIDLFRDDGRPLRRVPVPTGTTVDEAPVVAPDGAHVAVRLGDPAGVSGTQGIGVLDTTTGTWTVVRNALDFDPVCWAPDGQTLLLHTVGDPSASTLTALAYVRVGDSSARSLRVHAGMQNFLVSS